MYLQSYKELKVWQRSMELVKEIYKVTDKFPKSELYGLTSQMRRCSVSVPSNIAEGYKRRNIGEYIQFLSIADASTAELETQIIIAKEIFSSINFSICDSLLEEVQKMLFMMIKKLNPKRSTLNPKKNGFTIVELLVAMGLFVVLIGISTGGFIKALQTQKAIIGLMEANDNAALAFEQMAREIRTGYNFSKISETEIQFTNQYNAVVRYRLNEEAIERGTEDVLLVRTYKKITADNVKIKSFKVALFGADVGDGYPPRITISLSVGPTGRYLEDILTNIQTTISARTLDT